MLIKIGSVFIFVVLFIGIALLAPIDRKQLEEQPFYSEMMERLSETSMERHPAASSLKVGWATVNITPDSAMPMAGYKPRDAFEKVHDSLFVRILALDNGNMNTFIISADLLLFPKDLKESIERKLQETTLSSDFLYFSATHTHNGLGGWDDTLLGQFSVGEYHEEWIESRATAIIEKMVSAKARAKKASMAYWEKDARKFVMNRLDECSKFDGKLRGIKIVREDGTSAVLSTFSAHPTNISSESLSLSGDYPAEIMEELALLDYNFSIFLAGMVGSHKLNTPSNKAFSLTETTGESLAEKIVNSCDDTYTDDILITTSNIQVAHGPSQLRISKNFKLRDWVFRRVAQPLEAEIVVLGFDDILFMGTSSDFSGEIYVEEKLEAYSHAAGKKLIVTSFNGNYTGYITDDSHYEESSAEEVHTMNWVGPYYGAYYTEIMKQLIDKSAAKQPERVYLSE